MKKLTQKRLTRSCFLLSLMMVIGLTFNSYIYGATITYSVTSGNWTDANWTPQAPVTGDDVVIPTGAVVSVTSDLSAIELNSLSVSGSLIISSSAKLTVLQTVSKDPLVNLNGGVIQNDGTLSITQNISSNNNFALRFSDNANIDNSFTNTGVLNIDLSKRAAGQFVCCIPFFQKSAGRVSKMKLGGSININVPNQSRIFELSGTSGSVVNVLFDGIYSFGSSSDYKDWRLFHMGAAGTVTIAPTANISIYSNYSHAYNGVINMQSTAAPGSSFINNGTFSIYGGSLTKGYGIWMNTTASVPCTITNNGTLRVMGTFPGGAVLVAAGANTINNLTTSSSMTVSHSDPSFAAIYLKTTSSPITINNEGTLNLSTTSIDLGTVGVLNNTGTINYNTTTLIVNNKDAKLKVYSNNQKIYIENSSSDEIKVELIDLTGKILNNSIVKGESSSIIYPSLKGVFIVRIKTTEGLSSQKISL